MITREADYAIRMVLCLTRHAADAAPVPASDISTEMEIPYRFVRKIAGRLVRSGLARSHRGKAGGLRLARRPSALSVLDVLTAIDPSAVTLNVCLLDPRSCRRLGHCEVHAPLARIQGDLERALAQVTFASLVDRPRRA